MRVVVITSALSRRGPSGSFSFRLAGLFAPHSCVVGRDHETLPFQACEQDAMPFSSLTEPANSCGLKLLWMLLGGRCNPRFQKASTSKRIELAYIVAALASAHGSESDLTEATIAQFRQAKGLD